MRVVGVTGGTGFIGSWVVDQLHLSGYEPVILDRRGTEGVFLGDVRDANTVSEFAGHVDGIIHLAAVLGTQETISNPRPAAETNVYGTINVLEACRQHRLPLVNICVGNWWMRNTYSTTKHCAERLVEQYATELGVCAGNLRVVNAYGPRQVAAAPYGPSKVRKIIPAFVCRALSGVPVEVYGTGEQTSDMVYVADVARTLVQILEACADGATPGTLELGPTEHSTVLQVAETVIAAAGTDVPVEHLPMRPGEQAGDVTCDPATLARIGIDDPQLTSLADGVECTVAWFADARGVTWQ